MTSDTLRILNKGKEKSFPSLNSMEIIPFDRLVLTPYEIYHWLVRINLDGSYCYYTKQWTEKITFFLPPHVVRTHNEGNLKTLTLLENEMGEWYFHTYDRYVLPSRNLPRGKPYK